jgi:hypothetical protein
MHSQFNATFHRSLAIMKNARLTKVFAFRFVKNHFLIKTLNHVISQLTPAGIPNYLADYGQWYLFRRLDEDVIEDSRRIFSLGDLEYGFVLFLGAATVSILVFIGELLSVQVKRKLEMMIGLVDFLRVLRARMADYHDGW